MRLEDLKVLPEGSNEVLKRPTPRFEFDTFEAQHGASVPDLANRMLEIMKADNGIGLAAPQLGLPLRIFVMGNDTESWVCVNPRILKKSDECISELEGCLSFPLLYLKVERSVHIAAEFEDQWGETHKVGLSDIWARCFQHELDHLDGITFDTHVSRLALDMARRRRKKQIR